MWSRTQPRDSRPGAGHPVRDRPASPCCPGQRLGDRPLLQASLPRVARGRPGPRLGGETARRHACGRITPCSQQAQGFWAGGRQAGREDPSSCPSGFWSLGSRMHGPGATEQGVNKRSPSNMRREVSHTSETFVKLELLANGHLKFRTDSPGQLVEYFRCYSLRSVLQLP